MKGNKAANEASAGAFLHIGIANRSFERRFELADFVRVEDARLNDGLLTIELVREVPEAMKPRRIEIDAVRSAEQVEAHPEKTLEAA